MKISIIIPVYNSETSLPLLIERINKIFVLLDYDYEVICINDNSKDNSWSVLKHLAKKNIKIKPINLLKNYGQHNAVLCGFRYMKGDFAVTIDDDLQNPPEEIPKLIEKINEGYDCVFGKFREKKHSFFRKVGTKIIGYLNYKIFDKPQNITLSNVRIIKKEVIERVLSYKTPKPYIPGLVLMFSDKIGNVLIEHNEREIGKSNYNIMTILKLVSTILFIYSSFPIRLVSAFGFGISFFSFVLGLFYIIKNITVGVTVPGWTTVAVLSSFLGGYIILMLGMIGEYLARIIRQANFNKSYIVKEKINIDS